MAVNLEQEVKRLQAQVDQLTHEIGEMKTTNKTLVLSTEKLVSMMKKVQLVSFHQPLPNEHSDDSSINDLPTREARINAVINELTGNPVQMLPKKDMLFFKQSRQEPMEFRKAVDQSVQQCAFFLKQLTRSHPHSKIFYTIGKTHASFNKNFIGKRGKHCNPAKWTKKGLSGRWRYYKKKKDHNYTGILAFAALTSKASIKTPTDDMKFEGYIQECKTEREKFALRLEQRLIKHFMNHQLEKTEIQNKLYNEWGTACPTEHGVFLVYIAFSISYMP